jgi:hypothetical protein
MLLDREVLPTRGVRLWWTGGEGSTSLSPSRSSPGTQSIPGAVATVFLPDDWASELPRSLFFIITQF